MCESIWQRQWDQNRSGVGTASWSIQRFVPRGMDVVEVVFLVLTSVDYLLLHGGINSTEQSSCRHNAREKVIRTRRAKLLVLPCVPGFAGRVISGVSVPGDGTQHLLLHMDMGRILSWNSETKKTLKRYQSGIRLNAE